VAVESSGWGLVMGCHGVEVVVEGGWERLRQAGCSQLRGRTYQWLFGQVGADHSRNSSPTGVCNVWNTEEKERRL
jgi:hypothetical protein